MAPRRTRTITPIQALSLSNNTFMEQCSRKFAERVHRDAGDDIVRQIDRAWSLAFARVPNDRERKAAQVFIASQGLEPFCLALLNTNEFLFLN
jgi:hypothetical protein